MAIKNQLRILLVITLTCCCLGQSKPARKASVETVMQSVSPMHLRSVIDRLAGFGTRHTLSDTTSDVRGIGAARLIRPNRHHRRIDAPQTTTFTTYSQPNRNRKRSNDHPRVNARGEGSNVCCARPLRFAQR